MRQSRRLPREIAALDELFAFLEEEFTEHGVDDKSAFSVNLAAEELFTNMVRHNVSESASIAVETEIDERQIFFRLTDFDVEPFDPESAPTAKVDAPIEERTPGGLGLHLVKSMVNDVSYQYDGDKREMRVTVIKHRGE